MIFHRRASQIQQDQWGLGVWFNCSTFKVLKTFSGFFGYSWCYMFEKKSEEHPELEYRTAFLNAIDEFNAYGTAGMTGKHAIDKSTGALMYGLKVLWVPKFVNNHNLLWCTWDKLLHIILLMSQSFCVPSTGWRHRLRVEADHSALARQQVRTVRWDSEAVFQPSMKIQVIIFSKNILIPTHQFVLWMSHTINCEGFDNKLACCCPCAAFARDTLLNARWLLDGCPKGVEGAWRTYLLTNPLKQELFVKRVMFVFEITKRKAGKAQILRLSSQQWDQECDMASLAGACLEAMKCFRDPSNNLCFSPAATKTVENRYIEGHLGGISTKLWGNVPTPWVVVQCWLVSSFLLLFEQLHLQGTTTMSWRTTCRSRTHSSS